MSALQTGIDWTMVLVGLAGLIAVLALIGLIFSAVAAKRAGRRPGEEQMAQEVRALRDDFGRLENNARTESEHTRAALERQNKENRDELAQRTDDLRVGLMRTMADFRDTQTQQLEGMQKKVDENFDRVRGTMEEKVRAMQEGNEKKLDEMRQVVDEKLQKTLEERLGSSFKLVSDQLEQVYKNLGEMQSLSKDMGDIKNIFKNVKTRGTWGEVQLAALLEQMLTPEQYGANVKVRPRSDELVEFAIKLPGPGDSAKPVWLPIDSKFPMEDYQRLEEAVSNGDNEALTQAGRALETRILQQARDIRDKYIAPPDTTDFAILFLPVESLFAEVLRRPGLCERVQRECRVTVAGPTTLAALLNSLRMGFKTLAIQKRSGEVWELLGAVKKQFGRFADSLEAVQKHLDRASNTVRDASNYSNQIQKRLDRVEDLPAAEAERLLPMRGMSDQDNP